MKKFVLDKSFYFILATILLLIFCCVIFFKNFLQKTNNQNSHTQTLSPGPVTISTPSPISPTIVIQIPPTNEKVKVKTGTPIVDLSPDLSRPMDEKAALRKILPITNSHFTLKYNAKDFSISVLLNAPYEQNKIYFNQWLKDNHYDAILPEVFRYFLGNSANP